MISSFVISLLFVVLAKQGLYTGSSASNGVIVLGNGRMTASFGPGEATAEKIMTAAVLQ
jgi:hypothetical protein